MGRERGTGNPPRIITRALSIYPTEASSYETSVLFIASGFSGNDRFPLTSSLLLLLLLSLSANKRREKGGINCGHR